MKSGTWVLVVFVVALAGIAGWKFMRPPAPTPGVFAQGTTLASAIERSAAEGKPVLAVATADWCGACQSYKRGALADDRVAAAIEQRTIPVYINVDDDPADAEKLGISAIPATFLIRDGQVIDKFTGAIAPADLLEWLDRNAAPAQG